MDHKNDRRLEDSGKVERLENIVLEMKETMEKSHLDYKNASSVRHELDDIERRLGKLEAKPAPVAHHYTQPQSSGRVLADVRRILES